MGDGKALQMGTSHELGQNFAKAFDITYSSAAGGVEHAWTTSLGHLHPHDRRPDHVPRRRQRAAGAAAAGADPGVRHGRQGRRRACCEAAAKLRDALRDAGVRVELDDRVDTPFGRRAVDAELQGLSRYASRSARATWPPATWWWSAGSTARRRRCRWPRWSSAVTGRARGRPAGAATTRRWPSARRAPSRCRRWARRSRRPPTGWARVPWSAVGADGEAEANGQGVTVRCLIRADGSVPDSEDEPDLIADPGPLVLSRMRFAPGRGQSLHRNFMRRHDLLAWVLAGRVVADDERGLLLWIARGTPVAGEVRRRRARASAGDAVRRVGRRTAVPRCAPGTWHGPGVLKFLPAGRRRTRCGGSATTTARFTGWYVNLEEPGVRWDDGEVAGVDIVDQDLDIVVGPDRSWQWKDEDEFAERLAFPDHYWVRRRGGGAGRGPAGGQADRGGRVPVRRHLDRLRARSGLGRSRPTLPAGLGPPAGAVSRTDSHAPGAASDPVRRRPIWQNGSLVSGARPAPSNPGRAASPSSSPASQPHVRSGRLTHASHQERNRPWP